MADQTVTIKVPDSTNTTSVVAPTPKSGMLSTEFISLFLTVTATLLGMVPEQYLPLAGGLVGVYIACRTVLKAVHVLGYAKQIPDLPEVSAGIVQTVTKTEISK